MELLGFEETLPSPVPGRGGQAFAEHVQVTEVAIIVSAVFVIIRSPLKVVAELGADVMPMVKLMPLGTTSSPGIDPRTSCVRFLKYLGTKRVVSNNELLAGEPVTVDVDRKGISIPSTTLSERPLQ
jgi:hypothetical protein